jgi:hypothetical protein
MVSEPNFINLADAHDLHAATISGIAPLSRNLISPNKG